MNLRKTSLLTSILAAAALVAVFALPVVGQEGQPAPQEETLPERVAVIDVDSPERAPYRIAVPNLRGDGSLGPQGAEVMRNDFRLVSLFDVLDSRSFVADLDAEGLELTPGPWAAGV